MDIIWVLFFSFFKVGLFSIGGGYAALPFIQNQIVNINGLMTLSEFADLVTISQMTPGPISLNAATFVGTKLAGFPGAVLCSLGCIIPSSIISLLLAHFYYKYRDFNGVQTILASLRPAVVALITSAGLSILTLALFEAEKQEIILSNFRCVDFILFIGGLFLLRKYKANPILVIFGSGLIGTIAYMAF
ncbi:MAG TPA: chromate transporter [Firmicutes bacterium]|nr:chromate transporter [Bacillota bacterium]